MSPLLEIDHRLYHLLTEAGGSATVPALCDRLRTEEPWKNVAMLFVHRAAQRLKEAGLLTRDGDLLTLTDPHERS